jgi:thiazolylpeptide-type bacteriocin precursor
MEQMQKTQNDTVAFTLDDLFSDIDELEFAEMKEVTALPETAASSGSNLSNSCSTCGSSSCCSSTT